MVMRLRHLDFPIEGFGNLDREIDNLFGSFFVRPVGMTARSMPRIDVAEYEDHTEIIAEIPGVKKDDLKISVENDILTLQGERKHVAIPEDVSPISNETRSGEFTRSVQLPHPVKTDLVSAELSNGLLRIVLPKADEAKPREIRIQ